MLSLFQCRSIKAYSSALRHAHDGLPFRVAALSSLAHTTHLRIATDSRHYESAGLLKNRSRPTDDELQRVKAQTRQVYERHAAGWDLQRRKQLVERNWFERFFARLRPAGCILDLGCGAGKPIAEWVLKSGFDLTGIDYSAPMLELARTRYPTAEWIHGDMRDMRSLLHRHFDGIFSWDGSFHLTREEQRQLLVDIAAQLKPGGTLMMTVGPQDGVEIGVVEGESVYHASLAPEEYTERLEVLGFYAIDFVAEDPDCDRHSVVLATRG
jgi:SAM-dependent methyltransferase